MNSIIKKTATLLLCISVVLSLASCARDTVVHSGSKTKKPFQKDEFTLAEAEEIASSIIEKYSRFINIGVSCELERSDLQLSEYLSEDERMVTTGVWQECIGCKSIKELSEQNRALFNRDYYDDNFKDNIFFAVEYEGKVYVTSGNKGSVRYVFDRIENFEEGSIVAIASVLSSGSMYCGTYRFYLEKESGDFVIKKVVETANDEDSDTAVWEDIYKKQLLDFYSDYGYEFTDVAKPVLFDIDEDDIPELFVFCTIGARQITKYGVFFKLEDNELKTIKCDDFGNVSGSYNNISLYKDKEGKRKLFISDLSISNINDKSQYIKTYGNYIHEIIIDEDRVTVSEIAKNEGEHWRGEYKPEEYFLLGQKYSEFDEYLEKTKEYFDSLEELSPKGAVGKGDYVLGLYGITEEEIDQLFTAYFDYPDVY